MAMALRSPLVVSVERSVIACLLGTTICPLNLVVRRVRLRAIGHIMTFPVSLTSTGLILASSFTTPRVLTPGTLEELKSFVK